MVLLVLILTLLFSGCAKLDYLIDQGFGQIKLQTNARKNKVVLEDVRVSAEHKEKIKLVEKYKKFFYEYFSRPSTEIYTKTTMLDQKAVTYLIIASKFNEVKALEHCFPLMGCFPYLGFFDEKDSLEFKEDLEKEGMFVYKRPVYAYSTLGYFTDTILSSFFYYDDFELAELVFHELFHTIFFIEDEVQINENLANYFGKQLALEYFKDQPKILEANKKKLEKRAVVAKKIVAMAKEYDAILKQRKPANKNEAFQILDRFLENKFYPKIEELCKTLKVQDCKAANKEWNNASFAAYLTYQKKIVPIKNLREKLDLSLVEYFLYIENAYKNYEGEDFTKDIFGNGNDE